MSAAPQVEVALETDCEKGDSADRVRLCLFGRPRIASCADLPAAPVASRFETRRSVLILARLAISRHQTLTRSELAEALWPGDFFDATRLRLRQELSRLRRGLGEYAHILVSDGESLRLQASRVTSDVHEFEVHLRAAGLADDASIRRRALQSAISLSRSPFLEESDEEWVRVHRERLTELRYGAMVELAAMLLGGGEAEDSFEVAQNAAHYYPAREPARLAAALALADLGHVADAHAELVDLKSTLERCGNALSARGDQLLQHLRSTASSSSSPPSRRGRFWAPAPVETMYGREDELARLRRLLHPREGRSRLVTLTGIGGIGKTHLLVHAAHDLGHLFEGRVAFVDLTDVRDGAVIPDKILQALRLEAGPTGDPFGRVVAFLLGSPTLLVLDNVEQFGSGIGLLARKLLQAAPQLRIVASSRSPIRLAGEFRFDVTPLQIPPPGAEESQARESPAVQMFLDAAAAAGWSDALSDGEWRFVTEIVGILEGIPLGLQLAAVRLRVLGPRKLLALLRGDANFLVATVEGAVERHGSLRAAVVGSIESLTMDLRRALSALAVFRGGWTLEDATEVCGFADAQDVMERLLDSSLIYVATEGSRIRFRMLETIRTAVVELDAAHGEEMRRRHLRWIAGMTAPLATDSIGRRQLKIFDWLESQQDNVREALQYALQHDPETAFALCGNLVWFWIYRTTAFEADAYAQALFTAHGDRAPTPAMLAASYASAVISSRLAINERPALDRTLRLGEALGNRDYKIRVLVILANIEQNRVNYSACQQIVEKIEARVRDHDDDFGAVMLMKAKFEHLRGGSQDVARLARSSAEWFASRGDLVNAAKSRTLLAFSALENGDEDAAESILTPMLEHVTEIRLDSYVPIIHFALTRVHLRRGRLADARRSANEASRISIEFNSRFQIGEARNGLGRVALAGGELAEAHTEFLEAARIWALDDSPDAVAVALFGVSATLWAAGERMRATRVFGAAKRQGRESGARHVPFHRDFAAELERTIAAELGMPAVDVRDALNLDDAVRLAALRPSAKPPECPGSYSGALPRDILP